jgi:hypothetical protein
MMKTKQAAEGDTTMSRPMKYSDEGIAIPLRCPHCQSRKTQLSTYQDGAKYLECDGCYTVIKEVAQAEGGTKP